MSPARTRSSAVKQAPQQLSSPPATPSPTEKKPTREGRRTLRKGTHPNSAELDDFVENENVTPIGSSKKRKRTAPSKTIEPVTPVSEGKKRKRAVLPTAEADPGDLPHGLGRLPVNSDQAARDGTPPPTPESDQAKFETSNPKELVQSDQLEESVHLGLEIELVHTGNKLKIQDLLPDALEAPTLAPQGKKQRKAKVPYGHHFDATPFPDFDGPKSEVFYTVNGLLTTVHGEKKAPAAIPPPSKDWAGCGETPSVLDAMIRTLLSANTRGEGSGVAIKALFDTYGTVVDGKGRESVDWDLIRRSPIEKITKAIKPGGHQNEKGKRIKDILDMVFLENNIRRKAIADPTFRQKLGLDNESVVQESAMLTCVDPKILTLDHLHGLPYHQVFNALLKYPGIALKVGTFRFPFPSVPHASISDIYNHGMTESQCLIEPKRAPKQIGKPNVSNDRIR